MRPLESESFDREDIESLGRASVQIVHDLKNQLNGLKLYATFLRKRMEKSARPDDERETIAKLINGLERAADDMNTLVRYGRALEINKRSGVNLLQIMRSAFGDEVVKTDAPCQTLIGDYDREQLMAAFRAIAESATIQPRELSVRCEENAAKVESAVCEWETTNAAGQAGVDPFRSFAGSEGLRLALAAKIIRAHGGQARRIGASRLQLMIPIESRG